MITVVCSNGKVRRYSEESYARIQLLARQRQRTDDERERHRISHLGNTSARGHKLSEDSKRRIAQSRRGKTAREKNPNWKGGISKAGKMARAHFVRSIQPKVFERDGYKCIMCGSGGYLHADHIKSWSRHPELRFEVSNCQTLCQGCHYQKTFNRAMPLNSTWGKGKINVESVQ